MNKVFKIKYSVVKQEMIVVSELANNKDKTASQSNNHKQPLFFSFLPKLKPLSLFIGTILSASLLFSPSAFGRNVEMRGGKVGSYSRLGNQGASSIALNPSSASSETNGQTAEDSIAIGTEATTASATGSIAIGRRAKNEGSAVNSIAIGYGAKNESTASNSVTIARGAINRFEKSIVIGLNAYTQLDPRTTNKETRQGSVVIGENAKSAGNQSVSLGQNAWSKTNSISIGAGTFAEGKSTIAMGADKISGNNYNDQLPATAWNGTGTPPTNSIWDIFSDLYMGRKNTNTDYNASDRDPNKPEAFYTYSDFKTRYVDNPSASPTYAGKLGAIALGSRTIAAGEMSTAVGSLAFALADKSTAMGLRSFVARGAEGGTAIGEESRTFAENSVAIGNKTEASNAGSMAYGYKAKAVGEGAIAIGAEVAAGAQFDSRQAGNLLLNNGAYATLKNADKSDDTKAENAITAFTRSFDNVLTNGLPLTAGNDVYLTTSAGAIKKTLATTQDGGKNAIAIGNKTFASKANSVALGSYALADAKNAFALGSYSFVEPSATNTIAIGVGSYARGASSFLGGSWTSTLSDRTVVLGHAASISSGSRDALAMGVNAFIGSDSASSLALGMGSTIAKNAKSPDSLAIGKDTRIDAKDTDNGTLYTPQVYDDNTRTFRSFNADSDYMRQAMALGFNAKVSRGAGKMETGINAMAIGAFAQATLQNSTALGVNSKTDYTWEQLEAEPWVSKGATSIPTSGKTGVISVGSKGSERRIVNVASGSFDTDAVNVAQLKTIEERFQSEIDLLQNGGGVQYLSVEKTNVNGEAGKVASQIRKGESYERYVKLKTQLLYLDAREKLNGEKFNQTSLNKIRAAVRELEAEYSGELKTTASELNKVATQLNGETTANNFEKFNQYKTRIENATNADSARNVGGLTPEAIAQLKANNNYLNDGAKGQDSIAFGWQAKTSGVNNGLAGKQAIAIGFQANSSAENAISIGTNSDTSMTGAVAIGKGATVTAGGKPSIALGQDSTVANSTISRTSSATINGLTFNNFAGSPETLGVLSIGTAGKERKIVNVAAGDISQTSTEAINGSQLYATNFMLSKVAKSVKENFGGDANLGPDGTITFTNIGGTGQTTIHDAINDVRTNAANQDLSNLSENGKNVITGLVDVVKKADSPITVDSSTDNNKKKTFTVGVDFTDTITEGNTTDDKKLTTAKSVEDYVTNKLANFSTDILLSDGRGGNATTQNDGTGKRSLSDGFTIKADNFDLDNVNYRGDKNIKVLYDDQNGVFKIGLAPLLLLNQGIQIDRKNVANIFGGDYGYTTSLTDQGLTFQYDLTVNGNSSSTGLPKANYGATGLSIDYSRNPNGTKFKASMDESGVHFEKGAGTQKTIADLTGEALTLASNTQKMKVDNTDGSVKLLSSANAQQAAIQLKSDKILLQGANATTTITLDGVKAATISATSEEAVNGSQLNSLLTTVLGAGTDLNAVGFTGINNASPMTYKAAIEALAGSTIALSGNTGNTTTKKITDNPTFTIKGDGTDITSNAATDAVTFTLNKATTVAQNDHKAVTSSAVYSAIESAKPTVSSKQGESILKVEGAKTGGITGDTFKLSLDQTALKNALAADFAKVDASNVAGNAEKWRQAIDVYSKSETNNAIKSSKVTLTPQNGLISATKTTTGTGNQGDTWTLAVNSTDSIDKNNATGGKLVTDKAVKDYVAQSSILRTKGNNATAGGQATGQVDLSANQILTVEGVNNGADISTNATGNNISLTLNKATSITNSDSKAATSQAVYDAIKTAKASITAATGGIITVSGTKGDNINSDNWTIGVNYTSDNQIGSNPTGKKLATDLAVKNAVDAVKTALDNKEIKYWANGDNTQKKSAKLDDGLNFKDGTNTSAEVGDAGVVKFNLKKDLSGITSIEGESGKAKLTFGDALTLNDKKLTGLADGAISTGSKDAITGGQLRALLGADVSNNTVTNLGGTGKSTISEAIKYVKDGLDKGYKFKADKDRNNGSVTTATEHQLALGSTLNIQAADAPWTDNQTTFSGENLQTSFKDQNTIFIGLKEKPTFKELTIQDTTTGAGSPQSIVFDTLGVKGTFGGNKTTGFEIGDGKILFKQAGGSTENVQLKNVADGVDDNDAVNFKQHKDLASLSNTGKKVIQDQVNVQKADSQNFISVTKEAGTDDGSTPKTYKVGLNTASKDDLDKNNDLSNKIATADATKNYVDEKVNGLSQNLSLTDGTANESLNLKAEKLAVVGKTNQTTVALTKDDTQKTKTLTVGLAEDIQGVNSITFKESGQAPNNITGRMSSAGLTFKKGTDTDGSTTTFAEDGLTIDSKANSAQTNLVKVSREGFSVKDNTGESKLAPTKLSIGAENAEHVEVTKSGIALKENSTTGKSSITLAQDAITLAGNATGTAIKLTGVADGAITTASKDAINGGQLRDILGFDPTSKQNTAGQGIGGTGSKTIEGAVKEIKDSVTGAKLKYTANSEASKQEVLLSDGLDFKNGDNTTATVAASGEVKFSVNKTLEGMNTVEFDQQNGVGDKAQLNASGLVFAADPTNTTAGNSTKFASDGVTLVKDGTTVKLANDGFGIQNGTSQSKLGADKLTIGNPVAQHTVLENGTFARYNGQTKGTNIALSDDAITVSNGTGNIRVTGVANATGDNDAVNFGQYKDLQNVTDTAKKLIQDQIVVTNKDDFVSVSAENTQDGTAPKTYKVGVNTVTDLTNGGTLTDKIATADATKNYVDQKVKGLSQTLDLSDGTTDKSLDLKSEKLKVVGTEKQTSVVLTDNNAVNPKEKILTVGLVKDIEGVNSITFDKSGQDPNQVTGKMSSEGLTFKKGTDTDGSTTTFAEDGLTIDSKANSAQTNLVKVSRDGFSVKDNTGESKLAPTKLSIGAENAEHVEVTKTGIALKADDTIGKSSITLSDSAITLAAATAGDAIKLTGVADGNITANSKDAVNGGQLRDVLGFDPKDKQNAAGQGIGGTGSKTIEGAISEVKESLTNATLAYKANGANDKTVKLAEGLNFTNTTNIDASVEDNGVVKFTLKENLTGLKNIATESLNASKNIIAGGTVTVGGETEGIVLTKSGSGNDRTLSLSGVGNAATDGIKVSGVKAGEAETDAVNKGQLDKLSKAINDALGTTDLAVTKDPNKTSIFDPINGTAPTTFKDAVDKLTTAVNTGWGLKVGSTNKNIGAGKTVTVAGSNGITANLSNDDSPTLTIGLTTTEFNTDNPATISAKQTGNTFATAENVASAINAATAGLSQTLKFKANGDNADQSLNLKTQTLEFNKDNNLTVSSTGTSITYGLSNNITLGDDTNAGQITIKRGAGSNPDLVIGKDGKITGLANGSIATNSTDAVNGGQIRSILGVDPNNAIGGTSKTNISEAIKEVNDKADKLAATNLQYKATNSQGTTKQNSQTPAQEQKGEVSLTTGLDFRDGKNTTSEVSDNGVVKYHLNETLDDMDTINFKAQPNQTNKAKLNADGLVIADDPNNISTGNYTALGKDGVTLVKGDSTVKLADEGFSVKNATSESKLGADKLTLGKTGENHLEITKDTISAKNGSNGKSGINFTENTVTLVGKDGNNATAKLTGLSDGAIGADSKDAINGKQIYDVLGFDPATKKNEAGKGIGGTSSKTVDGAIKEVKDSVTNATLKYTANSDTTKKDVKLSEGLNFINGDNTTASVEDNGKVKVSVNTTLNEMDTINFKAKTNDKAALSSDGLVFDDSTTAAQTNRTTFAKDGVTLEKDGSTVKVAKDGFAVKDDTSQSKVESNKLSVGDVAGNAFDDHLEVSKTGISRLGGTEENLVSLTLGNKAVTLAGKDSAAVALKGVSSALDLTAGATAVEKATAQSKMTELLSKTNGDLNTAVNLADLQAVAQAGLDFAGNSGESHRTLGSKLNVKGEGNVTGTTAADNITVEASTDTLTIKLSNNITNISSIGGGKKTNPNTEEKAKITFEDDSLKVNDKTLTGVKSALDNVQVPGGSNPPTTLEKLAEAAKDKTNGGASSVVNVKDLSDVATALTDKGLSFVGDDSQKVDRKLGETLKLIGGANKDQLSDGNNIGVTKDTTDGTLKLRLAKELSQIASIAFDTAGGVTGKISSEGTVFTKGDKNNGGETKTTFGIDGVTIDNTKTVDGADVKTNLVKVATDGFSVKQGENESKLSPTKLSIGKETGSHIEVTNEGIALKENAADKSSIKLGTDAITLAGNAANQPIKLTGVANGSMAANSNDAVNGGQINKILGFDPAELEKPNGSKTGIGGTASKTIDGAIEEVKNSVVNAELTYRANDAADDQAKKVKLSKGLNFKNGTNTTATVGDDGVVTYSLNATLNEMDTINFATKNNNNATLNSDGLVFNSEPNDGNSTTFAKDGVTLTKAATDGTVSTIKVAEDGFSVKKVDGQGAVQNESKLGADKLTIGTPTADHFEATNTGIARKNGTANISSIELGTDAITLAGANATDGITLKGVKGGEISSTSKEAINGTQLNDLGATVLGATVKDDKTGFVAPDFAAINGKKDKPTTFKAAIDQLIEGMNSGINLKGSNSTDAHKALLGSTITIKQGDYTDNGTQYKGENLSVTLDNASQTFTVAMKKDPRFDTVKVGTDGENQLVINGSEISSKVKGADGTVSDGAKVTLGKDEITLSKGTGSDPVELKGVASAIDKITKVTKDDGTENSNPTVLEKLEQAAKDGASSVVNVKDLNNVAKAVQDSLTEKGLTFADDNGTEVKRKLGETLTVKGGVQETQDPNAEKKLTDNNIGVVSDTATNALVVKLAKEISDITSIATNTAGSSKSVFDTEGVTVTGLNQDNSNGQSQPTETGAKASYGLNGVSVKDTEGNTSTTNATTTQFVDKEGKTSMQTASGVVTVDGTHTSVLKADSMTMADQNGHSQLTANELSLIDNDGNNNIQTAAGTRLTSKDGDITAVTGKGIMSISPDSTKTVSLSSEGISLNSPNGGVNVTSEGFGFTGANNQFRTDAPRILATGIDAGNKKISNVADGDISPTSGDVVTGRQLYALMQKGIRVYGDEVSPTKTQTTAPTNANPTATTAPTASSTQGGATTANTAGGVAPAGNVATGDIAPTQPTLPEMNTALVDDHLAVPLGGSLKIHGDHNVKTTISADNQVGISLQPNISIENNLVIGSNDPEKAKLAAQEGNALVITNKDDGNAAMVFNNEKNMLVLSDKEAKPRAVLDGQNGALTLVGNDDSQVTLSSKKGKDIDGNDLSRLSVTTERTNADGQLEKVETSFATMDDGLKFKADGDKVINKKLNETVEIVGDENVTTSITDDNKVKVSLNKKIAIDEVKIPNTDPDAQEGDSIVINNGGIHTGNKVITGVKASDDPTSAVNRGQLNTVIDNVQNNFNQVNQRIGDLTRESRAGIAGAMATASLQNVVLPGKTTISVGTATFKGENAVAIGMSRLSDNGKVGIRLSGMSTSNGDKGAAMSVGFTF
ncbi:YadA-like family protein [Avibacterium paragallinarum]|uniref:YadA-like family protein n=1 Tax=Avibacterium paragallinarum TaxID=728 RepID=UPI00397A9D49